MSHLHIRTSEQDESHITTLLKMKMGLDRSEVTRYALALAASFVQSQHKKTTRDELIKKSKFIGGDSSTEITSINYKDVLKKKLKLKHGL